MLEIKKEETETGYRVELEDFLKLNSDSKINFRNEFCYQSNLIEGIKDPIDRIETMSEGEEYKWPVELGDHFRAWDFMFKNFEKNLEEKHILRMHKLLMKNLLKNPKQNAGKYRECAIWIGRKGGPKYEQIPELMNSLEYDIINLSKDSNIQDIWNIHHKFETIHPFVDGNGRTGRLLLNWLSLKHLGIFEVVTLEKRTRYYENISQYTSEFKKLNPNVKFYKDASFYSGMPVLDISRIGCWD